MAISLKLAAPPSDEEIIEISERNPGYQFERNAAGELIVTPTGTDSGWRELELGSQLNHWTKQGGRGRAFGPSTGFRPPTAHCFCRMHLGYARTAGRRSPPNSDGALPRCVRMQSLSSPLPATRWRACAGRCVPILPMVPGSPCLSTLTAARSRSLSPTENRRLLSRPGQLPSPRSFLVSLSTWNLSSREDLARSLCPLLGEAACEFDKDFEIFRVEPV